MQVTNCAFGDDDLRSLYLTGATILVSRARGDSRLALILGASYISRPPRGSML